MDMFGSAHVVLKLSIIIMNFCVAMVGKHGKLSYFLKVVPAEFPTDMKRNLFDII